MQAEKPWLRTQLASSLLRAAQANRARQVEALACFELARVFRAGESGALPDEPIEAVALLAPGEAKSLWLKRAAARLLRGEGRGRAAARRARRARRAFAAATWSRSCIRAPRASSGSAGSASCGRRAPPRRAARAFELDGPVALVIADVDALDAAGREPPRVKEPSRFPKVERDLAVLLARDVAAGEVAEAMREAGGPALQSVEIFDRFAGAGVAGGKVSVAFRLVFQRPDRTLNEAEVSQAMERVIALLAKRFAGELRERAGKKGEGS